MFDLVVVRPETEVTLMRRVAVIIRRLMMNEPRPETAGEPCGDHMSPRGAEAGQPPGSG